MVVLAWISLGACLILSVACVALVYDARGQRRAFGVAEGTIAALQRRVADHEAAIAWLTGKAIAHAPLRLVDSATTSAAAPREDEARLRERLRARVFHDGTTLEQRIQQKARGILDEEHHPNVRHCGAASCSPGAWGTCACPCAACRARRCARESA